MLTRSRCAPRGSSGGSWCHWTRPGQRMTRPSGTSHRAGGPAASARSPIGIAFVTESDEVLVRLGLEQFHVLRGEVVLPVPDLPLAEGGAVDREDLIAHPFQGGIVERPPYVVGDGRDGPELRCPG